MIIHALKRVGYLCPQLCQLSSLFQMFEEDGVELGLSKDSFSKVYLMQQLPSKVILLILLTKCYDL